MSCFSPIQGFSARDGSFVYSIAEAMFIDGLPQKMDVPCRKCVGCRYDRSVEWSVRAFHEFKTNDEMASFITLTYSDDFLPLLYSESGDPIAYGDFSIRHIQLFFKRMRRHNPDLQIKYFGCSEYGSLNQRPHYHFIVYGKVFGDRIKLKTTPSGSILYTSEELDSYWYDEETGEKLGFTSVGDVTLASCRYVAGYVMKKAIGEEERKEKYIRCNPVTGEIAYVQPERNFISLKNGGIGGKWIAQFFESCRKGFITEDEKKYKIPRYYIKKIEEIDESLLEEIKQHRVDFIEGRGELSQDVLAAMSQLHSDRIKPLVRYL